MGCNNINSSIKASGPPPSADLTRHTTDGQRQNLSGQPPFLRRRSRDPLITERPDRLENGAELGRACLTVARDGALLEALRLRQFAKQAQRRIAPSIDGIADTASPGFAVWGSKDLEVVDFNGAIPGKRPPSATQMVAASIRRDVLLIDLRGRLLG